MNIRLAILFVLALFASSLDAKVLRVQSLPGKEAVTILPTSSEAKLIQEDSANTLIEHRQASSKSATRKKSLKQTASALPEATPLKRIRLSSPQRSSLYSYFEIYDAWVSLDYDPDYDGYHSQFTLNFDADYSENSLVDVYAEIYISRAGGDWELLTVTDVFTLYSSETADEYELAVELNHGYPSDEYDLLIDLYEYGYQGIVATLEPVDDSDLYALPLEDKASELNPSYTEISYVASSLSHDYDLDGFYSRLELEFDVGTLDPGRSVYIEVDITDTDSLLTQRVTTDEFILATQTEFVDLDLVAGYPSGWYDVDINLVDSYTGERLAYAGQEFFALADLPLESENRDYYDDSIDLHVSGGGSLSLMLLSLLGLALLRRKAKTVAISAGGNK